MSHFRHCETFPRKKLANSFWVPAVVVYGMGLFMAPADQMYTLPLTLTTAVVQLLL